MNSAWDATAFSHETTPKTKTNEDLWAITVPRTPNEFRNRPIVSTFLMIWHSWWKNYTNNLISNQTNRRGNDHAVAIRAVPVPRTPNERCDQPIVSIFLTIWHHWQQPSIKPMKSATTDTIKQQTKPDLHWMPHSGTAPAYTATKGPANQFVTTKRILANWASLEWLTPPGHATVRHVQPLRDR